MSLGKTKRKQGIMEVTGVGDEKSTCSSLLVAVVADGYLFVAFSARFLLVNQWLLDRIAKCNLHIREQSTSKFWGEYYGVAILLPTLLVVWLAAVGNSGQLEGLLF